MNARFLASLAATAVILGACTAAGSPASRDAAEVGKGSPHERTDESSHRARPKGRVTPPAAAGRTSAAEADPSGEPAGSQAAGGAAPRKNRLLPPSVITDATGDQFGLVGETGAPGEVGVGGPAYSDIVRAAIEDRGSAYRFTLRFAGPLPERVEDNENLIAGLGLTGSDDRRFAVMVQGTRDGWNAVYQTSGGSGEVESWDIDGAEVVWTIPKSQVDVGDTFEWGASLRLLDVGGGGAHKGDKAPENGPRTYPEQ